MTLCIISDKKEVPKKKRWDLYAIYNIECDRIKEWLESKAHEYLAGRSTEDAKKYALSQWEDNLRHTLNAFSAKRGKGDLVGVAQKGDIKKAAPTSGEIIGWLLATIVATAIELVVLGIIVAFEFKGEGAFIIIPFVPAIILAVGGWLTGVGLGGLIILKKFIESEEKKKKELWVYRILLSGGIIAILLAIIVRVRSALLSGGSPLVIVLITIALGLIIILPKAFHKYFKGARKHYEEEIFSAQQHVAYKHHDDDSRDSRWEKSYRSLIVGEPANVSESKEQGY